MGVNFPSKPEIHLEKPPLHEVICQVKFPFILRLSKEPPVSFQEAIQARFPELEIEQGVLLQLGLSPAPDAPVFETAPKIYRFTTVNRQLNAALAPDFFALSTRAYSHWLQFRDEFMFVEHAVKAEFAPAYVSRIGLRFINRFTRENTGCQSFHEMLDMFQDDLTRLVRSDAWTEPNEMISQINLTDLTAKLNLRFGFGTEQQEPFILLDFDYFEDQSQEFKNLVEKIDWFHTRIYQAFRWCVKDDSLDRFYPQPGRM